MEIFGTQVPMLAVQVGGFILALLVICGGAAVYGFLTRDQG